MAEVSRRIFAFRFIPEQISRLVAMARSKELLQCSAGISKWFLQPRRVLRNDPLIENGDWVRLAICDSLSLATVVLLNDLGASALESQNRKPDPVLVYGFT